MTPLIPVIVDVL